MKAQIFCLFLATFITACSSRREVSSSKTQGFNLEHSRQAQMREGGASRVQ